MKWVLGAMMVMSLAAGSTASAQTAKCPPPPEWGATEKFGEWHAGRLCVSGTDMLRISARPQSKGLSSSLTLMCDADGPGGLLTLENSGVSGPVSLALGGAPAHRFDLEASELGVPGSKVTLIEFGDSDAVKAFLAALVDGPGPVFTLVLTAKGKPAYELAVSRNGLAAAVKPLRSQCAW